MFHVQNSKPELFFSTEYKSGSWLLLTDQIVLDLPLMYGVRTARSQELDLSVMLS